MTIPDPPTGYRTVQDDQDIAGWRHRLFANIRMSPGYKALAGETPEETARRLHLLSDGEPCPWAVALIREDRAGRFDPDRVPVVRTVASARYLGIRASLNAMSVDTCRTPDPFGERLSIWTHRPESPMQLAAVDWEELERMAVAATRAAVRDMRAAFDAGGAPGMHRRRIKAGSLPDRDMHIERLAYRLTGRGGERNSRKIDRDWCDLLGLDRLTG